MHDDIEIAFKVLENGKDLPIPFYQTQGSAGMDLYAALMPEGLRAEKPEPASTELPAKVLLPGQTAVIPCGFAMALPNGYEAQIRPRSGLAAKHGITVLNTPGTVDSDYRGEVMAILHNASLTPFKITRGDRIAQMVIAPVVRGTFVITDDLNETARGASGFGSTGLSLHRPSNEAKNATLMTEGHTTRQKIVLYLFATAFHRHACEVIIDIVDNQPRIRLHIKNQTEDRYEDLYENMQITGIHYAQMLVETACNMADTNGSYTLEDRQEACLQTGLPEGLKSVQMVFPALSKSSYLMIARLIV